MNIAASNAAIKSECVRGPAVMRHSCRQKHRKHLNRSAHIRRMCYFHTVKQLEYLKASYNNEQTSTNELKDSCKPTS